MKNKKYWKSIAEKQDTEAYLETYKNEFPKKLLPIEEINPKGLLETQTPRRDFLKYLGFSTGAAVLASSCKTAVTKSVPFLFKPEEVTPGVADYYATSFVCENEVVPILAKVRDGRPIKIEGNNLSQITQGGTSARVQANVLSLYDTARLRYAIDKTKEEPIQIPYSNLDKKLKTILSSLDDGKQIIIMSPSITSELDMKVLDQFQNSYPNVKIIYNDPVSYAGMLNANQKNFKTYTIPSYHFDKADVILSLDADFLGTWLSPVEFSKQWSKNRQITSKRKKMSKHYQIEPLMSMTGANADDRKTCKPSEIGKVAQVIFESIMGEEVQDYGLPSDLAIYLIGLAKELKNHAGRSLVVSGCQDENVQLVVNAINQNLGNYGKTITWEATYSSFKTKTEDVNTFVSDLEKGQVGAIFFANGSNPVYNSKYGKKIAKFLSKATLKVSFSSVMDETTLLCDYVIPSHHALESWGDASLKSSETYFLQPTISPLFETRYWQETFMKLFGMRQKYDNYMKSYWVNKLGSKINFGKALQKGVIENAKLSKNKTYNDSYAVFEASKKIVASKTSPFEVALYQKVSLASGSMANNPWLQEMPDPITKTTWDNYAVISPFMAKKMGIVIDDNYEVEVDKPVIEIEIENQIWKFPINIIPGTNKDVIGIAIGYGRAKTIGKAAGGIGQNVYPLLKQSQSFIPMFHNTITSYKLTNETYPLALTQSHNSYEGRTEVVKEFTLEEFKKHPDEIIEERIAEFKKYGEDTEQGFRKDSTLYPDHVKLGIKWGMSVDLNLCTGCNACVVACNAENNISVVGKKQVLAAHEMHWLRIDRYFSGNVENPEVVFQPMMCQHCDNAPCENVCPVAATNHSSEGLNQMTYNRCIGTRYCANNCPYKVRRFNWADWNGADSFKNNQVPLVEEGYLDEVILDMNEDLTRMVLNPDVTVRSRGVIEKCSFCVQRLQAGKLEAKKERRQLEDKDIQTACMQACPTHAIEFGNVNNAKSKISIMRNDTHKQRLYYALEQIHVLPNVNYLAKIRNKSEHSA